MAAEAPNLTPAEGSSQTPAEGSSQTPAETANLTLGGSALDRGRQRLELGRGADVGQG